MAPVTSIVEGSDLFEFAYSIQVNFVIEFSLVLREVDEQHADGSFILNLICNNAFCLRKYMNINDNLNGIKQ